jgi:hypothetical protein
MDAKRVSNAIEVLNWLATQIQAMPDRDRGTVESGIFLALSSVCLGDYAEMLRKGVEPYDALRQAADSTAAYRKQLLRNWDPLVPPVAEDAMAVADAAIQGCKLE